MELWELHPLLYLYLFVFLPSRCFIELALFEVTETSILASSVFVFLCSSRLTFQQLLLFSPPHVFLSLFRLSLKCLMVLSWDSSWDHSYPGDLSQNQALLSAVVQILRDLDLLPRSHCCSLTSSSIPLPTRILSFFIITCFYFSYNILLNMYISF